MVTKHETRKICVVTGSRAEYGLLHWLMEEIKNDSSLKLQVIATGMHLSEKHGLTYKVIEQDGFKIDVKIDLHLKDDSPEDVTVSLGVGVQGFAHALKTLEPDVVLVLGDRYEILAAAQAAMIARIPIAHLHGGELTESLIDEAIRHSITKMSHFHFVANETYKKRVIQLGEQPTSVMNVGTIALDNISRLKLLNREEFERAVDFRLGTKNFLITYHPVTLDSKALAIGAKPLLDALEAFPEAHIIFTKPNADTAGNIICDQIDSFVEKNKSRAIAHTSLGQLKYLSAIKNCDVVIGNSSSGLVEVPAMKKPTVNIGDRQAGRLTASSVLNCENNKGEITLAIKRVLSPEFQNTLNDISTPYGFGNDVSLKIKNHLKTVSLENILIKKFYDVDFEI